MNKVHPTIKTLLKRMESNPEEFVDDQYKWEKILDLVLGTIAQRTFSYQPFSDEERGLVLEKLKELRRNEINTLVMKELLNPKATLSGFDAPPVKNEGGQLDLL